jgi:hypothetical protein
MSERPNPFWPQPALSGDNVLEGVHHLWAVAFNLKQRELRPGLLGVVAHRGMLVP